MFSVLYLIIIFVYMLEYYVRFVMENKSRVCAPAASDVGFSR